MMLADLGIAMGYGLYTDMNALRPDEDLGNIHSIYVDQWDWERIIAKEDRNLDFLKEIVKRIYSVIKRTEFIIYEHYPEIVPALPDEITFIQSLDLYMEYPDLNPKEREYRAAKRYGAIFIIGVGYDLPDGWPHDGRAPDYDDWSSPTVGEYHGLNGDILVWDQVLQTSLELSSMGIRVDKKALIRQLEIQGLQKRKELLFHKRLLNGEYTESIGGGIGQSRLCMHFLRKAHIGEVQASIWPASMINQCSEAGIFLM
jgi:aspartate--ammonia ligase